MPVIPARPEVWTSAPPTRSTRNPGLALVTNRTPEIQIGASLPPKPTRDQRYSPRNSRRGLSVVEAGRAKATESPISASDDRERPIVVDKDRARQGVTGHNVRYVLGFGVVGIIVVFTVIYLIYFG